MKYLYLFAAVRNPLFFSLLCITLCPANVSAQVHIGSDKPPKPSAMLEVSAADKGILLPAIALKSVGDSSVIVNSKPVDGLLIFNTKDTTNLYRGVYAWNSVKRMWDNIISDRSFRSMLTAYYATEEAYFVANSQSAGSSQQIENGKTVQLTFPSNDITINRDSCFRTSGNEFVVPESGIYKAICGMDIYYNSIRSDDNAEIQLTFTNPSTGKVEYTSAKVSRLNIKHSDAKIPTPLTPSIIYTGNLEKGVKLTVKAVNGQTSTGVVMRKYLYINAL
jgi:hypothetical protein